MAITNPVRGVARSRRAIASGPPLVFAATVLTAFAALAVSTAALPRDLVLPLISSLFLAAAALVALLAWLRERAPDPARLTYWDVAGALTLIGICAAALVDPDQLVRLVQGPAREH
jgi:hypothetical protein